MIQSHDFFSITDKKKKENNVPRTLFEARKVAGSAKYTVKWYEIELSS